MPTVEQAKKISVRTILVNGTDKLAYKSAFNVKQMTYDALNLSVVEYVTNPYLTKMTASYAESVDLSTRDILMRIALDVAQDMALQKFVGSRQRSLMESVVSFAVSEVAASKIDGYMQ